MRSISSSNVFAAPTMLLLPAMARERSRSSQRAHQPDDHEAHSLGGSVLATRPTIRKRRCGLAIQHSMLRAVAVTETEAFVRARTPQLGIPLPGAWLSGAKERSSLKQTSRVLRGACKIGRTLARIDTFACRNRRTTSHRPCGGFGNYLHLSRRQYARLRYGSGVATLLPCRQ